MAIHSQSKLFETFSTAELKRRIMWPTGAGGFREDVKRKALKELMKRQAALLGSGFSVLTKKDLKKARGF